MAQIFGKLKDLMLGGYDEEYEEYEEYEEEYEPTSVTENQYTTLRIIKQNIIQIIKKILMYILLMKI